jgi:hypothetical protein
VLWRRSITVPYSTTMRNRRHIKNSFEFVYPIYGLAGELQPGLFREQQYAFSGHAICGHWPGTSTLIGLEPVHSATPITSKSSGYNSCTPAFSLSNRGCLTNTRVTRIHDRCIYFGSAYILDVHIFWTICVTTNQERIQIPLDQSFTGYLRLFSSPW